MIKPAKGQKDKEGKYHRIIDYEFDDHWSHKYPEMFNEIVQNQVRNFIAQRKKEREEHERRNRERGTGEELPELPET